MTSTNSRLVVRVLGRPCFNCYNVKMTAMFLEWEKMT